MRNIIRSLTTGISLVAASFGIAGSVLAHQDLARAPSVAQGTYAVPQHGFGHAPHSHHDYGISRRQAYHAGLHDVAVNFRLVDRNHDGLATRAEIAAFRHGQQRRHWHGR